VIKKIRKVMGLPMQIGEFVIYNNVEVAIGMHAAAYNLRLSSP
jgi:hypothetical protein